MVDFRRRGRAGELGEVAQRNRRGLLLPGDGDVEDRLERLDVLLAVLRADEVVVAVALINPERWREIDGAVQGGDDVLDDVLLCQPDLGRLHAVDVHVKLRRVEPLLDAHVHCSRHRLGEAFDLLRNLASDFELVALHLNVDGRRQAEVQRRRHHAAGVETEFRPGELARQLLTQFIHVVEGGPFVLVRKLDEDEGVGRP